MSMWLEYVKVSKETLEAVKKDGSILGAIFFEEGTPPADLDSAKDIIGLDYRTLSAMMEGMESAGMDVESTEKAIGHEDFGDLLDFEFTYGPAFCFTVEEVKQLAAELTEEMWDPDDDFEENIGRFFSQAAAEGKAIIGGIN